MGIITSIGFKYQVFAYDEEKEYGSKISIPPCFREEAHKYLPDVFEQIKIYFAEEHNIEVLTEKVSDLKDITFYSRKEDIIEEERSYEISGEFFNRG